MTIGSFGVGLTGTGLDLLGVVRMPVEPRELWYVVLVLGAALVTRGMGQRVLWHHLIRRPEGAQLARALRYQCASVLLLLVSGVLGLAGFDVAAACALAGYVAILVAGGRVTVLARPLSKPSVSTALLASRCAEQVRDNLDTWAAEDGGSPPLVAPMGKALRVTTEAGKASVFVKAIAVVLAVVIANVGASLDLGEPASTNRAGPTGTAAATTPTTIPSPGTVVAPAPAPDSSSAPPGDALGEVTAGDDFADLCGPSTVPGAGAPSRQAFELFALWLGSSAGAGLGAEVAGCPEPPRPLPANPDIWFAAGRCSDRKLQSLALASGDGTPVIVLQSAALFALQKAEQQTLVNASRRLEMGSGDAYLLETIDGLYLVVRPVKTDGLPASARAKCGAPSVAYTEVPPGLIDPWLAVAEHSWAWPTEGAVTSDGSRTFEFRQSTSGPIIATARCWNDNACDLTYGNQVFSGIRGKAESVARLLLLAP